MTPLTARAVRSKLAAWRRWSASGPSRISAGPGLSDRNRKDARVRSVGLVARCSLASGWKLESLASDHAPFAVHSCGGPQPVTMSAHRSPRLSRRPFPLDAPAWRSWCSTCRGNGLLVAGSTPPENGWPAMSAIGRRTREDRRHSAPSSGTPSPGPSQPPPPPGGGQEGGSRRGRRLSVAPTRRPKERASGRR